MIFHFFCFFKFQRITFRNLGIFPLTLEFELIYMTWGQIRSIRSIDTWTCMVELLSITHYIYQVLKKNPWKKRKCFSYICRLKCYIINYFRNESFWNIGLIFGFYYVFFIKCASTKMLNRIDFIEKFTWVIYTCSLSQIEEIEYTYFDFWDYFKSYKLFIIYIYKVIYIY